MIMNAEFYHTIKVQGESLFKAKGSRFIGLAFPVKSEDEIREKIESVKKQYHDARHHCYAWQLEPDQELYRANDDGEPAGTAGKPILAQIRVRELTNVLVVVTRYFGGTLLGTGGLIRAYRTAASEALDNAVIIRNAVFGIFRISFGYSDMNTVMKILKELDAGQTEQDFSLQCSLKVRVMKNVAGKLRAGLEPYGDIVLDYLGDE